MAALGDKISANILAQSADVPSIPWSGAGIRAALDAEGRIPSEEFQRACVSSEEEAEAAAKLIGFPVMIKASEGGGGKGIRMVSGPHELRSSFIQVSLCVHIITSSPLTCPYICSLETTISATMIFNFSSMGAF